MRIGASSQDGRESLGFCRSVEEAFAFLEALGYTREQEAPTLVRYVRGHQSVRIYHGRQSYELGVELCRESRVAGFAGDECYHLGYFARLQEGQEAAWPSPAATTPEQIRMFVSNLAADTQRLAMPTISGDDVQFAAIRELARLDGVSMREGWEASRLRESAETAWHAKDYDAVVRAYSAFRDFEVERLKPSELRRLRYAGSERSDSQRE